MSRLYVFFYIPAAGNLSVFIILLANLLLLSHSALTTS